MRLHSPEGNTLKEISIASSHFSGLLVVFDILLVNRFDISRIPWVQYCDFSCVLCRSFYMSEAPMDLVC